MHDQKDDSYLVHYVINVTHESGDYPIFIGENIINDGSLFNSYVVGPEVAIITDEQVKTLYLSNVQDHFSKKQCDVFLLPQGERTKNIDSFEQIADFLADKQHHRDTTLVALGGGVVGDLTGFVAACYHRGVDFIQVPTTLLAQVDSSIGGKTAVNQKRGKNLLGAFYQPRAVIIDLNTLDTLPEREYRSGIAEIIKAAVIKDAFFFSWLEAHMESLLCREKLFLKEAIFRACTIKQSIVMKDEKDKSGERALLNFGHTFGHAIEHNLGYGEWLHGEAVAVGMRIAAQLSYELKLLPEKALNRIQQLLDVVSYPTELPASVMVEELFVTMGSDKKVLNGELQLVLLKRIGSATVKQHVDSELVKRVIASYLNRS